MNPTYISTVILKPGALYEFVPRGTFEFVPAGTRSLDSPLGGFYYSVTRDMIVADGEELVTNDGALEETLFMVTDLVEVRTRAAHEWPWLKDHLANGGYEELDAPNMKALYLVAQDLVDRDEIDLIVHVSFLGDWTISSTRVEEGYDEIDQIDFAGLVKTVPLS